MATHLLLVTMCKKYGNGTYNAAVAAEVRWNPILDSWACNPTFDFRTPRYQSAYAESVFPYHFFVDGRNQSAKLDLTVARSCFQKNEFPKDFYRRNGSYGLDIIGADMGTLIQVHHISPGHNEGAVNYVPNFEHTTTVCSHPLVIRKACSVHQLTYLYTLFRCAICITNTSMARTLRYTPTPTQLVSCEPPSERTRRRITKQLRYCVPPTVSLRGIIRPPACRCVNYPICQFFQKLGGNETRKTIDT